MSFLNMLMIAVGLGMDAMSVCMGIGVRWHSGRQRFRLAWHMGLFQFLMPIIGWAVGSELAGIVSHYGSLVAGGLVIIIGAKMLYEVVSCKPGQVASAEERAVEKVAVKAGAKTPPDPTRGWSLVALSVATSLDALVVGFSLGIKGVGIWQVSILIGVIAAAMALAGVIVGKHMGIRFGRFAEFAGAMLLIVLGISFLFI